MGPPIKLEPWGRYLLSTEPALKKNPPAFSGLASYVIRRGKKNPLKSKKIGFRYIILSSPPGWTGEKGNFGLDILDLGTETEGIRVIQSTYSVS